jgi:hypothetical protein
VNINLIKLKLWTWFSKDYLTGRQRAEMKGSGQWGKKADGLGLAGSKRQTLLRGNSLKQKDLSGSQQSRAWQTANANLTGL